MARLVTVSFAGIDERTDFNELRAIQYEFPMVEWGVLCSRHWQENGNRYIDPDRIKDAYGLNLCAHLCGSLAKGAANGIWRELIEMYPCDFFHRCQINIANENFYAYTIPAQASDFHRELYSIEEIIIQQKDAEHVRDAQIAYCRPPLPTTFLLDASGGQGIDTPWSILNAPKVGYAGGITPDNVVGKVRQLMCSDDVRDFWIDMESGVRTDDWFDTKKVREVLNKLRKENFI